MNENNSIEAKLLHIIFHNESNGYSVLKFLSDEYEDFNNRFQWNARSRLDKGPGGQA